MYNAAMDGIHNHLISKGQMSQLTYTSELIPERNAMGQMYVPSSALVCQWVDHFSPSNWRLMPKQDHLVCFFGGSLMLGAVTSGASARQVSVPPRAAELAPAGKRDWQTGVELIETCMATHDTATGLSPEIAHFRIPSDGLAGANVASDWYIKGAKCVAFP